MTATTNKGYTLPVIGGDTNTWGSELNANYTLADSNLGGTASINCAGSLDITLNSTQAGNLIQSLSGLLTGSISVKVPQTGSFYVVKNGTTGAYTVTVKTSNGASVGVIVPQGSTWLVYSDGTNVQPANWNDGTQFYGADSGTASAIAATLRVAIAAYFDGLAITVKIANVNSANATLNANGIGAKPIYVPSGASMTAIGASVFSAGQDVTFIYDTALNGASGGWQVASGSGSLSNVAYTNVANTFTDDQTLTSTDAGASAGPNLILNRNSASPAANDFIGAVVLQGRDSGGNLTQYADFTGQILDATDGSEDAWFVISTMVGGAYQQSAAIGDAQMKVISADASSALGPQVILDRASASPAIGDLLGRISYSGRTDTATTQNYAQIGAQILDPSHTAPNGSLFFYTVDGDGNTTAQFRSAVGAGLYMAGATGGDKGAGTINATGLYVNGSAIGSNVSFSAVKSSNQSVSASVATKIAFTTEEWDDNNLFASSTFTPTAGKWRISACLQGVLVAVLPSLAVILYKNGSAYKYGGISKGDTSGFESGSVLDVIVSASGTDTFEIYGLANADITIDGTSPRQSYFQGERVS